MKPRFIGIVGLSLIAYYPVSGDGSGWKCVSDCIPSAPPEKSGARWAFQQVAPSSSAVEDPRCADFIKLMTCVEACPAAGYVILARESRLVVEKYCGADEATRNKFFADNEMFQVAWTAEQAKCLTGANTPEGTCTEVRDCVFGSALTSATNGFSEDVVSANVNSAKVVIGSALESSGEKLPNSCDVVFEPYQPVPYPPEPPYPYEPYHPESYQRNPYQRNPYQRNPYQRNPYQRNPYQRNHYKRKSYRRNPY